MFFIPDIYLENLIKEDLHILDVTTMALGIEDIPARLDCFPKSDCVVAGLEEAARIFRMLGAEAEDLHHSGQEVAAGEVCLRVKGKAGALHAVYKLAQNIMEYSSGIAGRCRRMVRNARAVNPGVEVAVIRKHFPGTKLLALKACLDGGASIHRLGLYDSILVFDQHREFMGGNDGFLRTVQDIRRRYPEKKVCAEVDSPEEALSFAQAGVDVVQCERFAPDVLAQCLKELRAVNPAIVVSVAGGVNEASAAEYAATGVDILVTSWVYFGKPDDIKMKFHRATEP